MSNLYRRKLLKIYNKIDSLAQKGRDNFMEYYKYIDEIIEKGDYGVLEQCLFYYYQIDITTFENVKDVKEKTWNNILFQTKSSFLTKLKKIYDRKNVYQISYDIFTTDPNYIQTTLSGPYNIDIETGTYSETSLTQSISFQRVGDIMNVEILDPTIYSLKIYKADWIGITPSNKELIQFISPTQSVYKTSIPTTHSRDYLIETEQRPDFKFLGFKLSLVKNNNLGQIKEIDDYSPDSKYYLQNQQYASLIGEKFTYLEVYKNGSITTISDINPNISEQQNLLNRYSTAIDILNS
jgi:hypothetical protein